jgi:hypothetical protein
MINCSEAESLPDVNDEIMSAVKATEDAFVCNHTPPGHTRTS